MPEQKDNPATPAVDEAAILSLPIDLRRGKKGLVYFTKGQATYFGISTDSATATGGLVRISRSEYKRFSYDGLWDTEPDVVDVAKSDFYLPTESNIRSLGVAVLVHTKLQINQNDESLGYRTTTFKVPEQAILSVVSDWLATNLTKNTPSKFLKEGCKWRVVVAKGKITDLNPGRKPVVIPVPG